MHHALHEAQKAYGLTGDTELRDILVDIINELASEKDRTVRQIALNEDIEVARKVTVGHIRILVLIFLHTLTRRVNINFHSYMQEIENLHYGMVNGIRLEDKDVDHLVYTGCFSTNLMTKLFG